jgi:hypothetical protein
LNLSALELRQTPEGVILPVKVVPGASRDRIAGLLGTELKVTTTVAAEKGRANKAVAKLLADALGVSPGAVELVSAPANPHKEFHIAGMTVGAVRETLSRYAS